MVTLLQLKRYKQLKLKNIYLYYRLEVFFTAFEKNKSEFGFSLISFRMACSPGMRSLVWIWTYLIIAF